MTASSTPPQTGLVPLSGTTTFCKQAIEDLCSRRGIAGDGYLELEGSLQREPENAADPLAVAVHVEGERIAYLPSFMARQLDLAVGISAPLRVQIFSDVLSKGFRAEAWGWLGEERPRWRWSRANRPPLSSEDKARANHADIQKRVRQAAIAGGVEALEMELGLTRGVHYLELVEPIKQLKREQRLEDALVLCRAAIEGAEADCHGREPAPWYTEQAAIILRKLGQRDAEIDVLERWLRCCPRDRREGSTISERLIKLQR